MYSKQKWYGQSIPFIFTYFNIKCDKKIQKNSKTSIRILKLWFGNGPCEIKMKRQLKQLLFDLRNSTPIDLRFAH
jgi:hypothetical protein